MLDEAVQGRYRPFRVVGREQDASGRPLQGGELILQDQLACVEHTDPGAQGRDLRQQVAGEEDRHALVVQADQQVTDIPDAPRVEAVRRLVEDEQPGAAHQRAGQAKPLAHAE